MLPCGDFPRDVTIMLVSESLIVTHVSTHVSLREAVEAELRADELVDLVVAVGRVAADRAVGVPQVPADLMEAP